MKKFLFFVFAMACISTISYAQDVKEIKPFKPSAEDAAKIKNILASMDKSAYSIQVSRNKASYGSLGRANVKAGSAFTSTIGNNASKWVESVLTKVLKSTKSIDQAAVVQLQAIAAKY